MNEKKTKIIILLFIFISGAIVARLLYFQVFARDQYISYIQRQYFKKEKIVLPRGIIYDSNKKVLSVSVNTLKLYAIPKYLSQKQKQDLAQNLSKIINVSKYQLLAKLQSKKGYVVLADNVDINLKSRLLLLRKQLKAWNFGIIETSKRFYPYQSLAGSTIGFVRKDTGKGAAATEYLLNDTLGGGTAEISVLKDGKGNPISTQILKKAKPNYHAVLTIDSNVQYIVETALKKLVRIRKPKEAAILIMDSFTGDIIATATYPNYNPNKYWKYKSHKNIIFHNAYEVGSLAKPFILAQAIDENKLSKFKKVFCEKGKIIIDGVRIKDHKRFTYLTPEEVIIKSSNIGTIKIALDLDYKQIYKRLRSLGFGTSTKTFPGEAFGLLKEDLRPVNVAYTSIGQSWTATILQIAVAYSAIANGGFLVKPRLIKEIVDSDGNVIEKTRIKIKGKVLSDKSVSWLQKTLKLVVEKGTAKTGKSKYFSIAGKTGTAQKYDPRIKALSTEKFYTWFAGYFPANNPKFTIVVFVNEPKKIKKWEFIGGGTVSAPILKDIVDRIMYYYKEKPDKYIAKTIF
ncbi:MAG: penicillin-binding protein 2 [Aquificae bacterium]|nr:penicillin-binding protein 2 [Aquificota bacterium]